MKVQWKRLLGWFFWFGSGFLAALLLLGLAVALSWDFITNAFGAYDVVAVSWGSHSEDERHVTYQVRVTASDHGKDGNLSVYAAVYINEFYCHPMGNIGEAKDWAEAVRNFSQISWEPDRLVIGGAAGEKAALARRELESHR